MLPQARSRSTHTAPDRAARNSGSRSHPRLFTTVIPHSSGQLRWPVRCFTGGRPHGFAHRISDMQVDVYALEDVGRTDRTEVIVRSPASELETDFTTAAMRCRPPPPANSAGEHRRSRIPHTTTTSPTRWVSPTLANAIETQPTQIRDNKPFPTCNSSKVSITISSADWHKAISRRAREARLPSPSQDTHRRSPPILLERHVILPSG